MTIFHLRTTSKDLEHWTSYFGVKHHDTWFDIYKTVDLVQPEKSGLMIYKNGCDPDIGYYSKPVYSSTGRTMPIPADHETREVFNAFVEQWN